MQTGSPQVQSPDSFRRVRGCSSAGRALESHSRGRGFDPHQLHNTWKPFIFFGMGPRSTARLFSRGPSVRSRSAPQDAPSSPCYQGLFGCPDFESATGSSGWCSCSHNVARIRAAWCPLRPARPLRQRPSAGRGTWPWSRAACGRCGDALLVAAGRGSVATEELGGDVARHAADSLPSSTWLSA